MKRMIFTLLILVFTLFSFSLKGSYGAPKTQTSAQKATQQTKSKTPVPFFQNGVLKLSVNSISKSKDKKRINLVLTLENITKNDLLLALARTGCGSTYPVDLALLDRQGGKWDLKEITGCSIVSSCLGDSWSCDQTHKENYTLLKPGTKVIILAVFKSDEGSDARTFDFSANLWRYTKNGPVRYSLGIPGIKIPVR